MAEKIFIEPSSDSVVCKAQAATMAAWEQREMEFIDTNTTDRSGQWSNKSAVFHTPND